MQEFQPFLEIKVSKIISANKMYYIIFIAGEKMGEILITFIKQSFAYKLKTMAKKYGISAKIVQTPKELSRGGCSYGILARRTELEKLLWICREYEIDYKRVLAIYMDINGKKVYNEI